MIALILLIVVLLAIWVWSLINRDGSAAFMQPFIHVPFIAACIVALMAIGALLFR